MSAITIAHLQQDAFTRLPLRQALRPENRGHLMRWMKTAPAPTRHAIAKVMGFK